MVLIAGGDRRRDLKDFYYDGDKARRKTQPTRRRATRDSAGTRFHQAYNLGMALEARYCSVYRSFQQASFRGSTAERRLG